MNIVAGVAGLQSWLPGGEAVDAVRAALRRYAAGPCNTVMAGSAILGVASTFEDAPGQPQPYHARSGILLAFDGRMDRVDGHELTAPDTDIDTLARIAACQERYGTGMFERLTGDYGLVLYDSRTKSLVLGRDFVGAKHLYIARTKDAIYFATNLTVLLHLAPVSVDPDMHYIAQFFAGTVDTGRSPYREIGSVRAGAWMSVDLKTGAAQERPYWFAHTVPPIRYTREEEYEEHFRGVFQQSVARRMRSPRTVLADLSGGLDSSSIVCMADRVSAAGGLARVETWTARYSDSPLEDEGFYVGEIEKHRGRATHWLREHAEQVSQLESLPDQIVAPCFLYYAAAIIHKLGNMPSDLRTETHLCGYGGDQVTWNCDALVCGRVIDEVMRYNCVAAARRVATLAIQTGRPAVNILRANWNMWRHYRRARKRHLSELPASRVLDARFVYEYGRAAITPQELADHEFRSFTTRIQAAFLDEIRSNLHVGLYPEEVKTDRRYPYLDRDLNEYLIAIPFEAKKHPGETRSLMRRSLRGIIPESVRTRESKGIIDVTLGRACAAFAKHAVGNQTSASLRNQVLDPLTWSRECRRAAHGLERRPGHIVRALVLDAWLERIAA